MSRLSVVVHIGMPKAASTALQAALAAARGRLLDEAGACYPVLGGAGVKDQRPLADALDKAEDPAARQAVLTAIADARDIGARTVLLSGESVYGIDPVRLRALLDEGGLADVRLEAVAVVRDSATWLNSQYAFRAALLRETASFAPWSAAAIRRGAVDLSALLGRWTAPPIDRFTAVPLKARGDPRPVTVRAAEAMGVTVALEPATAPRNAAPDPRVVEAALRLSRRGLRGADRATARAVRRRLETEAAKNGWTSRFCGLDPTLAARISVRTAASCDAFAARVWGRRWEEVYDAPDPAGFASNEWRRGGPGAAEVAALVEKLSTEMALGREGMLGFLRARLARLAS